jgi:hypothetical protein
MTGSISMRLAYRIIGGLMIVAISFVTALAVMDYMDRGLPPCPTGSTTPMNGAFSRFGASGFAYLAPAPAFDEFADSGDNSTRSKMLVCEDGYLLGPAHSSAADITKNGRGRFTHWKTLGFVFSTSDNTDPNNNGRHYSVVGPK